MASHVSPTQSRWTGWEPPAPPRKVSGTANTTGPDQYASDPGPDDEALARQEEGWDPSPRERDRQPLFPRIRMTHPALLIARQWIPPRSILPKSPARTTSCFSGSPPLDFRSGRPHVLRLKTSLIPAKTSSLRKRAASSETIRPYIT